MIGRLTGILLEKQPPHLLLEVAGVGYEVEASMQTFYKLPELGQRITLFTHLSVREDAHLLFGFFDLHERGLFRQLIKINGIGPKLALTILSSISPEEFARCIHDNDSARLVRLPGVGKKTADRLIIEMRDRLEALNESGPMLLNPAQEMASATMLDKLPSQDAISALVTLGYKFPEAQKAVSKVNQPGMSSEEIIRLALKGMAKA